MPNGASWCLKKKWGVFIFMKKKVNLDKLEFYVLLCGFGNGEPKMFNIFNNIVIREAIIKILEKGPTREELKKELDSVCMNQLWSRCQYEIIVTDFPQVAHSKDYKIDAYYQVKPNLDMITDYLLTLIE